MKRPANNILGGFLSSCTEIWLIFPVETYPSSKAQGRRCKNIFGPKYTGSIHPSSLVRRHLMSARLMWQTTNNTHFPIIAKSTLKRRKYLTVFREELVQGGTNVNIQDFVQKENMPFPIQIICWHFQPLLNAFVSNFVRREQHFVTS